MNKPITPSGVIFSGRLGSVKKWSSFSRPIGLLRTPQIYPPYRPTTSQSRIHNRRLPGDIVPTKPFGRYYGSNPASTDMAQPSWTTLPTDLPKPEDDGACDHLQGSTLPSVSLPSTAGSSVDPSKLSGLTVLFCYPRTGAPGEVVPDEWNAIPGARGCTPQACSFRDASKEFLELGVSHIYGVSTQDTPYQQELKERIHLPYELLSDEKLEFLKALKLPTFEFQGATLIKRMVLAVEDGKIVWVRYPDFPSDKSAAHTLEWLKTRTGR